MVRATKKEYISMRYQKEKQNRLRSEKAATNEHELNVIALLGMGKRACRMGALLLNKTLPQSTAMENRPI